MLGTNPDGLSCEGIVKSLVWDEGQNVTMGVSAAEDGKVRWVYNPFFLDRLQCRRTNFLRFSDGGTFEH